MVRKSQNTEDDWLRKQKIIQTSCLLFCSQKARLDRPRFGSLPTARVLGAGHLLLFLVRRWMRSLNALPSTRSSRSMSRRLALAPPQAPPPEAPPPEAQLSPSCVTTTQPQPPSYHSTSPAPPPPCRHAPVSSLPLPSPPPPSLRSVAATVAALTQSQHVACSHPNAARPRIFYYMAGLR